MKSIVVTIFGLILIQAASSQSRINIIPKPEQVVEKSGEFTYNQKTRIYASKEFRSIALLLAEMMKVPAGQILIHKKGTEVPTVAVLIEKANTPSNDSAAYTLDISKQHIHIKSLGYAGAINAMQSLVQVILTNNDEGKIPCAEIVDKPRFGYRGLMIDVSRHFFPPSFIKKMIDLIGLYKINTLHLHLTDAAGWRIQIKKYPKLTEQAAWRNGNSWKSWWNADRSYSTEGEPSASGGYYTQEDAKDIVAYAKVRGITIIPEIEMPGHTDEVIAAYPHLGCVGNNGKQGEFCLGNDSTFIFMQDVITELLDIFPSTYIHIGGDEAGKSNWEKCSKCQKRIKDNNLKDAFELQSYAIRRMEKFIASKGRQLLGWDEILEGGLAPGARVMSWRGEQGGIEAARMGHDVIMTPGAFCYFDKYQQEPSSEPEAIGGFLPLQQVYAYEPMPAELEKDKQQFIKGAQANVWTEYIPTMEHLEYMVFPRIIALSETVWSKRESMNWKDFQSRLLKHYAILQKYNVNYCRPSDRVGISPVINIEKKTATITLNTEQFNPDIRYTTDGSIPSLNSLRYNGPFEINGSAMVKAGVLRSGKIAQLPDTLPINFHKAVGKKVNYNINYDNSYPAQKETTLTNGYRGSITYQDGQWQGFTKNMDITIDLGSTEKLSNVQSTFMQIIGPGVYLPDFIDVSISTDGSKFEPAGKSLNDISPTVSTLLFKTFKVDLTGKEGRYIRFFAKHHDGYLFADEVIVE